MHKETANKKKGAHINHSSNAPAAAAQCPTVCPPPSLFPKEVDDLGLNLVLSLLRNALCNPKNVSLFLFLELDKGIKACKVRLLLKGVAVERNPSLLQLHLQCIRHIVRVGGCILRILPQRVVRLVVSQHVAQLLLVRHLLELLDA